MNVEHGNTEGRKIQASSGEMGKLEGKGRVNKTEESLLESVSLQYKQKAQCRTHVISKTVWQYWKLKI